MSDETKLQQLMGKLATLERRADHLQRQLDNDECSRGARSFIAAERSALDAAIVALRLHHAEVEGLDTLLRVLTDLIAAVERLENPGEELTRLLERASVAVLEFDALARASQEGKTSDENDRGKAQRFVG